MVRDRLPCGFEQGDRAAAASPFIKRLLASRCTLSHDSGWPCWATRRLCGSCQTSVLNPPMPPSGGPPSSCSRAGTPTLRPSLTDLVAAPAGNAGWLLPIEPLLHVSAQPDVWAPAPGTAAISGRLNDQDFSAQHSGHRQRSTRTIHVMEVPMRAAVLMLLFTTVAFPLGAQTLTTPDVTIPPPPVKTVNLSGPRFGFTALSQGVVADAQAVEPSPSSCWAVAIKGTVLVTRTDGSVQRGTLVCLGTTESCWLAPARSRSTRSRESTSRATAFSTACSRAPLSVWSCWLSARLIAPPSRLAGDCRLRDVRRHSRRSARKQSDRSSGGTSHRRHSLGKCVFEGRTRGRRTKDRGRASRF